MNNLEVLIKLQHKKCEDVDSYAIKADIIESWGVYNKMEREAAEEALALGWAIDIIEMARQS